MLGREVIQAWSEEAARGDDPVLAALLLRLAALRGRSDHWSIELLKRIADLKASEGAACLGPPEEDWPDLIEA
ncbi:MAG TPA: hypothetical protein VF736_13510 [Pyrinomonadaceae bacterium]